MNADIIDKIDREIDATALRLDRLRQARATLAELLPVEARDTPSDPSSIKSSGSDSSGDGDTNEEDGGIQAGTEAATHCDVAYRGDCAGELRGASCPCGETYTRCATHNRGQGTVAGLLARHRERCGGGVG